MPSAKLEVDSGFVEKIITIEPIVTVLSKSQEDEKLKEASSLLHEFTQHVKESKSEDTRILIADLATKYATTFE